MFKDKRMRAVEKKSSYCKMSFEKFSKNGKVYPKYSINYTMKHSKFVSMYEYFLGKSIYNAGKKSIVSLVQISMPFFQVLAMMALLKPQ